MDKKVLKMATKLKKLPSCHFLCVLVNIFPKVQPREKFLTILYSAHPYAYFDTQKQGEI